MSDLGVNFAQLRDAVNWSVRQLEIPRTNRVLSVKQYVGSHYAAQGSQKRVPTNFLELAVTIYTRQLAAQSPRAKVATGSPSLKPLAKSMEIALNQIPDEIGLGATLRRAVMEALFSLGVVKVGISSTGVQVLGYDVGEPFVDIVNLDDYFCDMSADSWKNLQYEGNDYWLPIDAARAMYGNQVQPDDFTITGDNGEIRSEEISKEDGADLYKDKVWLRDVWLTRENKLLTYGVKGNDIYNIIPWDGPEHSPYHVLGFADVPGNLLPLPPVALWTDLHELANILFRKLGRQADAKKTVAAFSGGNDDDIKALRTALDGDGIGYHGKKPESLTVGGIDAPTLALFLQTKDLFSYLAGNLDSLGGLAPSTDTVGQDKLLSEAANARLKHMRDQTVSFARGIFKSLAWYEWTDPVRERTVEKTVKSAGVSVRRVWSQETREGDFLDYNFDIDPYSMQDNTPDSKLQKIRAILESFIMPLLPMMEQQGGQLDMKQYVELIGDLSNVPELLDMFTFREPMEGEPVQAAGQAKPTMGNNTTRTYDRVVRPGATRSGKDHVMSQLLMGSGVQSGEAATAGRPVS